MGDKVKRTDIEVVRLKLRFVAVLSWIFPMFVGGLVAMIAIRGNAEIGWGVAFTVVAIIVSIVYMNTQSDSLKQELGFLQNYTDSSKS